MYIRIKDEKAQSQNNNYLIAYNHLRGSPGDPQGYWEKKIF